MINAKLLNKFKTTNYFSAFLFIAACLYSFLFLPYEKSTSALLLLTLILTVIYTIKFHPYLLKTTPVAILLLATITALITWLITWYQIDLYDTKNPRLEKFTGLFLFIPLAIILAGNELKTYIFWGLAVIGALATPWLLGNGYQEILEGLQGNRTGFGNHIITMGIIYATILIAALILFFKYVFEHKSIIRYLIWFAIVFMSIIGVISSGTRSIYLGLASVYLLLFLMIIYLAIKDFKQNYRYLIYFISTTTGLIVISIIYYNLGHMDTFLNRANNESSVLWLLLSGNFDAIPRNSAGLRIHFWIDAVKWIAERPISGWGARANGYFHSVNGNMFGDRNFITLHNDLIEIIFTYGILGLAIFLFSVSWVVYQSYQCMVNNIISKELFIFLLSFLTFFFINSMFMSLLFFKETIFLWNLVLAGFTGFIIKHKYLRTI